MRPFLLGTAPSLADFGFMGPMFRHFSLDPTPSRLMRERAPAVYEWVARLWNTRGEAATPDPGAGLTPGTLPAGLAPLLRDVGAEYLSYLTHNARAIGEGRSRFDLRLGGREAPR